MIELLKNKLIIFKIFFLIFILSNCTNTKSNNKVSQSSDIKLYSKGLASLKKGNFSKATLEFDNVFLNYLFLLYHQNQK